MLPSLQLEMAQSSMTQAGSQPEPGLCPVASLFRMQGRRITAVPSQCAQRGPARCPQVDSYAGRGRKMCCLALVPPRLTRSLSGEGQHLPALLRSANPFPSTGRAGAGARGHCQTWPCEARDIPRRLCSSSRTKTLSGAVVEKGLGSCAQEGSVARAQHLGSARRLPWALAHWG